MSEDADPAGPREPASPGRGTRQRLSRPHDARALRSRSALRAALLSLVARMPLEQITIKDITAEAGVSYPVFFRQFASQEELLADIATEEIHRLLAYARTGMDGASTDGMAALCRYVEEHRRLWKVLLTGGAAAVMRSEFYRIALETGRSIDRVNAWLPIDLITGFSVSGIFEVLAWWLRQPDDYPTANIVKILDVLVVRVATQRFDIELE